MDSETLGNLNRAVRRVRPDLEFQRLAEETVRELRGEISQRDLSLKLGFSFNQVGKWESGSTKIKWDDFLDLLEVLNLPIEKHLRQIFYTYRSEFSPHSALAAIMANHSLDHWPWPRSTTKKWLRGTASPILADALRMLDAHPAILFSLLSKIVDCTKLSVIREDYAVHCHRMDNILDDPNCVYVNGALALKVYQEQSHHDEALLAEHSACTIAEVRKTLATLLNCEVITMRDGKYLPCPFGFSFSHSGNVKVRTLTKYTTDLLASRYSILPSSATGSRPKNPSVSSVRVVAMSSEAAKKAQEAVQKFHHEMAKIVAEDNLPKDGVQIVLVHSVASTINSPSKG